MLAPLAVTAWFGGFAPRAEAAVILTDENRYVAVDGPWEVLAVPLALGALWVGLASAIWFFPGWLAAARHARREREHLQPWAASPSESGLSSPLSPERERPHPRQPEVAVNVEHSDVR